VLRVHKEVKVLKELPEDKVLKELPEHKVHRVSKDQQGFKELKVL
jgi:hypothetical protein